MNFLVPKVELSTDLLLHHPQGAFTMAGLTHKACTGLRRPRRLPASLPRLGGEEGSKGFVSQPSAGWRSLTVVTWVYFQGPLGPEKLSSCLVWGGPGTPSLASRSSTTWTLGLPPQAAPGGEGMNTGPPFPDTRWVFS